MPRPEGSANKNKQFLMKRLQDMYGEDFHPIMQMAKNAIEFQRLIDEHEKDPDARGSDLVDANKLWDQVAQYVEPKLKAVEISGDPDKPVKHSHSISFVGVNADSN